MYHGIFRIPVLNFIFRTARAIPIAGRRENAELYEAAFVSMRKALDDGDLLCLFPEGGITYDGEMQEFKPGILKILEDKPVQVVPMALQGLWGSLFSRSGFARIALIIGEPMEPSTVDLASLHSKVLELRGERR